jgi:hypothetical protein
MCPRRGVRLITDLRLVPRLKMSGAIPPLISASMTCVTKKLPLYLIYRVKRRNGSDFGRVFLMLNYTEKPQNTYIQSSMVTEI